MFPILICLGISPSQHVLTGLSSFYIAAWTSKEAYLNLLRSPGVQVCGFDLCDMYANGAMDSRAANTHKEPEVP